MPQHRARRRLRISRYLMPGALRAFSYGLYLKKLRFLPALRSTSRFRRCCIFRAHMTRFTTAMTRRHFLREHYFLHFAEHLISSILIS